ncbi:MAG: tetratricopeptide repeat protein [Myxococcota bacterium]
MRTVGAAALLALAALCVSACGGGGDLEQRLDEIRTRQDDGKAAETLDELSELVTRNAEHAELNYRLGLAMIAAGRSTEAVFPLHKAAAADEFAVSAGLVLASTLANTNNHAEALRAVDRVLEREPEHEAALLLRALSAVQLHDGAAALASADRLVAKAPDNRNYSFVRGAALAESDRLGDAEAVYRELLDADWVSEPQGRVRSCSTYARFLFEKRKDTERAIALMKECVEKNPEELQIVAAVAEMLGELERREDLVAILEGAVERNPDARGLRDALVGQLIASDRVGDAKALSEKWASEADDVQGWIQVASVRRRTGDFASSLAAVDKALELAGPNPAEEIFFFRSELLLELGRLDEAEQQAASVRQEIYRTILDARLAEGRGDLPRALELYGKVSIQWPQNHAVRALAARAAYEFGDVERAKSELLEATRQAPKETDAALYLANIFFAEGNYRQTLAYTGRHIKERGVLDPTAHLLSAEALTATNRFEGALKVLGDLAKVRDGQFRSVALAAEANLRARLDPAKALAELERRLGEAKLDLGAAAQASVLGTLVDLLLRAGRTGDAMQRIDGLLAGRPDSAHLRALRGRIALAAGQSEAATADFERALALDPNEGVALSGQALLQRAQGDLAKAIETMQKAAAARPDNAGYAYMAARMRLDQGDRAAGRQELERVLRAHPESAAAANDLAFLLAEDSSDLQLAQRYAERAVRLQPSAETLDTLGYVKLRKGAAEEAVGLFERALSRQPDYATARYHLALALIEKGEPAAARQALEEALAKPFPESQEARKVLAKIDGAEARP